MNESGKTEGLKLQEVVFGSELDFGGILNNNFLIPIVTLISLC